jgi:hypothetical protein
MPARLPPFTEHHLLPEGVHDCTLAEVEAAFGEFQRSQRRMHLLARLRDYVEEVTRAGWDAQIVVDGSFVMPAVDEPEDIDLVLVLPEGWDLTAEVRPFEYNLVSRKRTRRLYGFDVFAVRAGSPEEALMLDFFQQVNVKWSKLLGLPNGLKKGIVRLVP